MAGWGSGRTALTAVGEGALQRVEACRADPGSPSLHSRGTRLWESGSCRCKGGLTMSMLPHQAALGRRGEVASSHSWPSIISSPCSGIQWSQQRQRARGWPTGQLRVCTCRVCPSCGWEKLVCYSHLHPERRWRPRGIRG